jgi:hypothetical protein
MAVANDPLLTPAHRRIVGHLYDALAAESAAERSP